MSKIFCNSPASLCASTGARHTLIAIAWLVVLALAVVLPPPFQAHAQDATVESGMLYVQSNVPAQVRVAGAVVGESERVLSDLPAGKSLEVQVEVTDGTYVPTKQNVVLKPGRITRLMVTLERRIVSLRITTEPSGADVFVDDAALVGRTPLSVDLPADLYNVIIVKEGFREVVHRKFDLRKQPVPEISDSLTPGRCAYDPFRRAYSDKGQPQRVTIYFGADDQFILYHNGREIGRGLRWDEPLHSRTLDLRRGDIIAAFVADQNGGQASSLGFRCMLGIGSFRKDVGKYFRWFENEYEGWNLRSPPRSSRLVRAVPHERNNEAQMYWGVVEGQPLPSAGYVSWRVDY